MKLGNIQFARPFISLAPLAGYGDVAFRRICRDYGASLTVTEMVSVKGLVYGNEKTEILLRLAGNETPSCVQLFGSEPDFFCRALSLPALSGFDIIDINMGCPVPKVTKCGEGSALMLEPERAADIVRACVSAAGGRPVTVKHRLGYYDENKNAPEFAAKMQEAGAAAITVHGRTTKQGYGGVADWDEIARVARAVTVPVIGNGDISCREDAEAKIAEYGCAGVAVGRGAIGNPDIFADETQTSRETLKEIIKKHISYALEYFPPAVAVRTMRKHLCKYLSRVRGTKQLRLYVNTVTDAAELIKAVNEL